MKELFSVVDKLIRKGKTVTLFSGFGGAIHNVGYVEIKYQLGGNLIETIEKNINYSPIMGCPIVINRFTEPAKAYRTLANRGYEYPTPDVYFYMMSRRAQCVRQNPQYPYIETMRYFDYYTQQLIDFTRQNINVENIIFILGEYLGKIGKRFGQSIRFSGQLNPNRIIYAANGTRYYLPIWLGNLPPLN